MGKYVAIAAVVAIGILAVSPANSGSVRSDADRRWIPGFTLDTGIRILEIKATVDSDRGFFDGESTKLFAYLGTSVQLMTPVVADVSSSPRFFVRIGVGNAFDGDERIVNEGGPAEIVVPGAPTTEPPLAAVFGQGSATAVKASSLIGSAGIGADFSFEFLERRLHVRPSFEWIVQQQQLKGLLGYAEVAPTSPSPDLCPCLTAFVRGVESEYFHGIGPGIELGMEAGRLGPFLLNIFASAQSYYELDRKMSVVASGLLSDGSREVSLRSTYKSDRWDHRIGMGVRLDWLPE